MLNQIVDSNNNPTGLNWINIIKLEPADCGLFNVTATDGEITVQALNIEFDVMPEVYGHCYVEEINGWFYEDAVDNAENNITGYSFV
jgi:hypothetical protein